MGEFKEGKRHGKGTISFVSGDKYVGGFEDSKKEGEGTYTWANGDKYVGDHKND
ncbi:MAG: membrane-binding protein, partial [Gammaproteobacteria bacterium]|nr:membrane-binding protein [Gammaproteobacteria bacterium]